jgi:hypothetical protein
MATDVPVSYTVVLEATDKSSGVDFVRAIATSSTDQSVSEALLTRAQTRSLLEFANGGEQSIVDKHMEQLELDHRVEVRSSKNKPCIFLAYELVKFGWNPEKLEMGFAEI